jgi:hypothetical protein
VHVLKAPQSGSLTAVDAFFNVLRTIFAEIGRAGGVLSPRNPLKFFSRLDLKYFGIAREKTVVGC